MSLTLPAGKVTAIIGENGAGKSTLMKILSGVYNVYDGQVLLNGQSVRFAHPREARDQGIAIIYQELNLVPHRSICENIFLGRELTSRLGLLDITAMRNRTRQLLQRLQVDLDPDVLVHTLKVGQQQVVEIAKALLEESAVIIMDEPTSAISEAEVAVLFDIIRSLKKENKAIVYISHKLDELFAIADRYVVLRDGKAVGEGEMAGMSHDMLVRQMIGRQIQVMEKESSSTNLRSIMQVEQLCLQRKSQPAGQVLKNVSFTLQAGEVLGIFGLMGAGRTELLETLFGMHPKGVSGNIIVDGTKITCNSPAEAIRAGIVLVPEDRKRDGLVPAWPVKQNISLATLNELSDKGFIDGRQETALANKYIGELGIRVSSPRQAVRYLSGGNQQKVVLAKWLATHPKILMLDEPTRGIDINAKNEIYKLIVQLAAERMGIIVVSSELPEILAISDRILVLAAGTLVTEFPIADATEVSLLRAAISNGGPL